MTMHTGRLSLLYFSFHSLLYLQEVIRQRIPIRHLLLPTNLIPLMQIILRRRRKHIKESLSRITNLQHTRHIATSITVIGRRPYCAEAVVVEYLVAFLAELVSAQDVRHAVYFEEFLDDLRAEGVACPAG